MVLVFIFLGIIIIIFFILTMLLLSTIQIKIESLTLHNKEKRIGEKSEKVQSNLEVKNIKISVKLFGKFTFLWVNLNDKKLKQILNKQKMPKIDLEKIGNTTSKKQIYFKLINFIKKIQVKIKNIKLSINIGTTDAVLTSYLTAAISSIVGIILPHITKIKDIENCSFLVNPKYQNKNEYYIYFDGIIYVEIVHIIFSMLNFVKKGSNKNEQSSNRRSYAYSNE